MQLPLSHLNSSAWQVTGAEKNIEDELNFEDTYRTAYLLGLLGQFWTLTTALLVNSPVTVNFCVTPPLHG